MKAPIEWTGTVLQFTSSLAVERGSAHLESTEERNSEGRYRMAAGCEYDSRPKMKIQLSYTRRSSWRKFSSIPIAVRAEGAKEKLCKPST
jgi:hypothetical protein